MAVTQAQVDALNEAIAEGVVEYTYEGKTVKFGTLGEMIKASKFLQAQVNQASTASAGAPRSFVKHSRG